MSKNLKYHVALTVKDQATSGIKKAMAEMERGETKRAQSYKRFSEARRNLSIRAESDIQREIKRTEASYNRLARAGFSSANEQRRAYQAMTNRVRELNAEMGKTGKLAGTFNNLAKIGGGIAAGATVGYNLAKEPVRKVLDFDEAVAHAANTAFSDRDKDGRIKGAEEIKDLVFQTIQQGGSKEDALSGINKMLSFGTLSYDEVAELMPTIQKTAVATNSSTEDISMVVNALMQSMKLSIDEIPLALDMALKAGQGGSFELGDMSKWLPQQLASASSRGMRGMDHYREILVMNEQAAVVAGTNDQAGNYVDSFLLALLDSSTNNALANSDYKEGNKEGIDLAKSMMAGVDAGLSPVQAFMGIMDKFIAQDAEYQKLEKEILSASGAEREAKLQQLMTILESSKISQILGNKQALMGFLGVRLNQEYGESLSEDLKNALGAVDVSHQVIASTSKFKENMAANNYEKLQMDAYRPVADAYASLLEKLDAYGAEYPELTKSIILARDALITLGTAAAGMALLSKILGKGGGGLPWGRPPATSPGGARPPAPGPSSSPGRPPTPTSPSSGGGGIFPWLLRGGVILGGSIIQKTSSNPDLAPTDLYSNNLQHYEAVAERLGENITHVNKIANHKGDFHNPKFKELLDAAVERFNEINEIANKQGLQYSELQNYYSASSYGRGFFSKSLEDRSDEEIDSYIQNIKMLKEQGLAPISRDPNAFQESSSIEQAMNNYQPLLIGGEIMNLVKQNLEQIKQQHTEISNQPTIIELHVTGEIDGRPILEIYDQHVIDKMNRGSNY